MPKQNLPIQSTNLELDRCPHCSVAKPYLYERFTEITTSSAKGNRRSWKVYLCAPCGGMVLTSAKEGANQTVTGIWPGYHTVDEAVPERAREYLSQAIESLHAPAGAVMLAASAVDAMLKTKGYEQGHLFDRINKAADDHLITAEMAKWAHEIRLDANDQRHADNAAALPSQADGQKTVEFAQALAQFLFILPARVARGRGNPTV